MKYQLLHALNVGRDDVVSLIAPQVFFNENKTPNQENIANFEKMASCKVYLMNGRTKTSGYIIFNNSKFDFS